MKRLLLILLLMVPCSAWAQSALATQAAAMTAGTWHKMTGVTGPPDTYGDYPTPTGIVLMPYSSISNWDSLHHFGYFFGGAHPDGTFAPDCYSNQPLCAEESHRLIRYDEGTNTWSFAQDLVSGHYSPYNHYLGHSDGNTALDPATGDVYRLCSGCDFLSRFQYSTQSWSDMAAPSTLSGYTNNDVGSMAWFPEANGIVKPDGSYPGHAIWFWDKQSNAWSNLYMGESGGGFLQVAIYNPVQHNMLVGSGHTTYGDCTKFQILSYSRGSWSLSTDHTIPSITGWTIEGNRQICFDSDSQSGGNITVDPVTGHYIVLAGKDDGSEQWVYDVAIPDPDTPANDTWTLLTGTNAWPTNFSYNNELGGRGAGNIGGTPVQEYGVLLYLVMSTSAGHAVETWLFKPYDQLSFDTKCALPGVIKCRGFDSDSDLRYNWQTVNNGDSQRAFGHICDTALTGHTNYQLDFTSATSANATSTLGPGDTCTFPIIDTAQKVSGAGSLKFPIPGNSQQAVPGDYLETIERFSDGTAGYIGPDAGMAATNGAHHLGDDLWLQFYMRMDSNFLSTSFTQRAWESFGLTTMSAGATRVYINTSDCMISGGGLYPNAIHDTYTRTYPNYPSLSPVTDEVNTVGRTIRFVWGTDFDTTQNFTIVSLPADGPTMDTHCSMVLNASPTPSHAGGGPPSGSSLDLNAWGLLSGTNQTDGQKGVGIYGDSDEATHTDPTAQVMLNYRQYNVPGAYSYAPGGSIVPYPAQPIIGCNNISPELRVKALTDLTEPPCVRFHAAEWQQHTIHIKLFTPGAHNVYESWINGIMVQRMQNWSVDFQEGFASNGMGAFFFSPYNTAKDPNQSHSDAAIWVDDLIISTRPIPMGANGTGSIPPPPPSNGSATVRVRH